MSVMRNKQDCVIGTQITTHKILWISWTNRLELSWFSVNTRNLLAFILSARVNVKHSPLCKQPCNRFCFFIFFNVQDELVRCLHANGYTFAAITELDCRGSEFEAIYKFAVTERLFYQQLKIIQKAIIEPLMKTGNLKASAFKDCLTRLSSILLLL